MTGTGTAVRSRFLTLLILSALGGSAVAGTVYVDIDNTSGTENGSQTFPYRFIQAGINATEGVGDEVLVAPGTYIEAIIVRDGVDVVCTDPPNCVINATGKGSAVTFLNARLYPSIDGFTIKGGSGQFLGTTIDGRQVRAGGGVRLLGAAIVRDNVIEHNVLVGDVCQGAGIIVSPQSQKPVITGNTIRHNSAICEAQTPDDSLGGGIYLTQKFSETIIEDNVIEHNEALIGGGLYAVNLGNSTSFIQRNVFQFNTALEGAALYTRDTLGTETAVLNNMFFGNGTLEGNVDCDDTDPSTGPGLPELCNDDKDNDCDPLTPDIFDTDGDGVTCEVDCDDANPLVGTFAVEQCNDGIDNDCDGLIDGADPVCQCGDNDGDGYSCEDCNDADPAIYPAADEVCNDGKDNDCDPLTLDVADDDGDGFNCAVDCNDDDAGVHPDAQELYCDEQDNDCNPATPDVVDLDMDLFDCRFDCNDDNLAINPDAPESCFDGIDNDCNGAIDAADGECNCADPADSDGDGFRCSDCDDSDAGSNPSANEVCNDGKNNDCRSATPDIFDGDGDGVMCDLDCRDFDGAAFPGAFEQCDDGIDNDCDGAIDGVDPDCACADADSDGFACSDCDDGNPTTHPGAEEICNDGIDNDCDPATLDVIDADGDGVNCLTDCNDADALIYPGSAENCDDFKDNDCDGLVDVLRPAVDLVKFGSPTLYLANLGDPGIGLAWTAPVYDETLWTNGLFGVGYQRGGGEADALIISNTPDTTTSVYTRTKFEIVDVSAVNQLLLGADYDDGYVAWLNGTEVYRSPEMPAGPPAWNANPALHESSNGQVPNYGTLIDISGIGIGLLQPGTNVLAIGLYNNNGGVSSDLVIVPLLRMSYGADDGDCLCPDNDGDGYSCTDCDDTTGLISPAAPEEGCNLIDDDCNPATLDAEVDADNDGFDCTDDCNDNNSGANPAAPEVGCNGLNDDCNTSTSDIVDADADGVECLLDCDDADATISPNELEIPCDGIDNDCSTLTPDDVDGDLDGFRCSEECDDSDPAIRPDAAEKCNDLIDNNCDGLIDGADPQCGCDDLDLDGYACPDCNDAEPLINPGLDEICDDGLDNDCDPATLDVGDADGDGFDCLVDCDDANPFTRPGGLEQCNDGIDNDCDPMTPDVYDTDGDGVLCDLDCRDDIAAINPNAVEVCGDGQDNDCNPATLDLFDSDGDGAFCALDCDDDNEDINPSIPEVCNDGIDNDCNPETLDLFDADGDGSNCALDCNDADPNVYPGAPERCDDDVDGDCDAKNDNSDPDCTCGDGDGDGYECALDCNDADPAVNPGAAEVCADGVDNDCDATTLDIDDLDGDGFTCNVDCIDTNAGVNPAATEACGDGLDNDCNAETPDLFDLDGDGSACNVDCDDADPSVNPTVAEITCDQVDNDCDPGTPDLFDGDGDSFGCVDTAVRGGGLASFVASDGVLRIVNNTFVQNEVPKGSGGAVWIDGLGSVVPAIFGNNILVANGAYVGGGLDLTLFGGLVDNNAWFDNAGGDVYNGGSSMALVTNNMFVDPMFAAPSFGNYRLHPDSPLVDAANTGSAPTNDISGFGRPYDGNDDAVPLSDVGAFEYPSGEVFGVVFDGPNSLTWQVRPNDELFNVYRGDRRTLPFYIQDPARELAEWFCGIEVAEMPLIDSEIPPPGRMMVYLVTVTDGRLSFEGTLGAASSGQIREQRFSCNE